MKKKNTRGKVKGPNPGGDVGLRGTKSHGHGETGVGTR